MERTKKNAQKKERTFSKAELNVIPVCSKEMNEKVFISFFRLYDHFRSSMVVFSFL